MYVCLHTHAHTHTNKHTMYYIWVQASRAKMTIFQSLATQKEKKAIQSKGWGRVTLWGGGRHCVPTKVWEVQQLSYRASKSTAHQTQVLSPKIVERYLGLDCILIRSTHTHIHIHTHTHTLAHTHTHTHPFWLLGFLVS